MPFKNRVRQNAQPSRRSNIDKNRCLCCAHLLRELNGIIENHPQQAWARKFKEHLLRMKKAKDKAIAAGKEALSVFTIRKYKREYDDIIEEAYAQNPVPEPVRKSAAG